LEEIQRAEKHGQSSGALEPIPTSFERLEQNGIPFIVRVVDNLTRKPKAYCAVQSKASSDPFLPYEPDLYVADVSDSHVAVLNKYHVMDRHLLVVTRQAEDQENLLTVADFFALWRCLREVDGLGFYNGGEIAGASQRHKHLQLVPFPLSEGVDGVPIAPVVLDALEQGKRVVDRFAFRHAVAPCEEGWQRDPHAAACSCHSRYLELFREVGIEITSRTIRQPMSYNFLMTRRWMMLVPRSSEKYEGISINGIGYAGGLLVRNATELALVRAAGPMEILKKVGISIS
jgi:ATP adenylyltransferase